jgi:hypothetical protein
MFTEIKTFEDACNKLNIQPVLPDVSMLDPKDQPAVIANYKLDKINQALNDGWEPNWDDRREWKYFPWFKQSSSGSGFSYYGYCYDCALSNVGSRRVFKSSEIAIYAGQQFTDLYKTVFTLN